MQKEKEMPGYMTYREAAIMFSLMPDDGAAQAIKATVKYYLYGEIPEDITGVAAQVFNIMKADIDRSRVTYQKRCEGGSKGGNAHWHKDDR